jgi:hypothetical protein
MPPGRRSRPRSSSGDGGVPWLSLLSGSRTPRTSELPKHRRLRKNLFVTVIQQNLPFNFA